MAKKPLTVQAVVIRLLEEYLKKEEIAYIRKNHGLQIGTFGRPQINCNDDRLIMSVISGTTGFFGGSKKHQELEFEFGHVANPETDVKKAVNRVIAAIGAINELTKAADNDTSDLRLIEAPSGTVKSAVKAWTKKHKGIKFKINCYKGRVDIRLDYDGIYGRASVQAYLDGKGLIAIDYNKNEAKDEFVPVDELLNKWWEDAGKNIPSSDKQAV